MRFPGEHVQTRAGELPGFQQIDQCVFVDDAAAGDVDEESVRAECLEYLAIDEVFGAGATGRGDDEDVDVAGELGR